MSNKNILLISPFFFPELISTGKYNTYLAKGLVESGCKLDILCSHPLYPNWKPEISDKSLKGMEIIRGGGFVRYPASPLLRRFLLEIWLLLFVLKHSLFSRKKYDTIILIFPPNLLALLVPLLRSRKTSIIGVVHDIQGIMANSNKSSARRHVMKFIHWIERFSYNSCDKLIFLSENMKETAKSLYGELSSSISIKYPFVTIEPYTGESKLDSIFLGVKRSLVYSGALGEKQAPDNLLRLFMNVLDSDESIHAYIFSQGAVFEKLQASYNHDRLHFLPFVDEEDLPELISRSTVQVIPQNTEISDGAFPSKLPNILAAGTKLCCITHKSSEIDTLLSSYSRVLISYSWSDETLTGKLVSFLNQSVEKLSTSDVALLDKFSLSVLIEDFV